MLQDPQNVAAVEPLFELATISAGTKTRYSFILTDAELVVVRIHLADGSTSRYNAQWQSIPWDAHGPGVLTVGVALWALVMMSLHRDDRKIVAEADMKDLNFWWKTPGANGNADFTNHYSRRQVGPNLPAGAAWGDSPAPPAAVV